MSHFYNNTSQEPSIYPKVYKWLISSLSFVYVVIAFGFSGIPGVSRLALYSSVLMIFVLACYVWKLKLQGWIFLILFFYSYMAIPALARATTSFDKLGMMMTVLFGTLSIGLALQNKILSYKVIVYGSLIAAIINIFAITMGIESAPVIEKGRSSGLMANPNALSMSMAFAAFMIWLVPERFSWPIRLFGIFVALYGMYVSGSRKGLLLVAALLILVLMDSLVKLSKPKLILFVTVILAALFMSYTLLFEMANKYGTDIVAINRASKAFAGHDKSFNDREILINTGYKLWEKSPLFGHGFGQFANLSGFGSYAHNNYIELAVSGGIIALILFYSIHFIILRNAMKQPIAFRLRLISFLFTILLMDMAVVTFYGKTSLCTLIVLLTVSSEFDEGL